jgi:hypothetical protein
MHCAGNTVIQWMVKNILRSIHWSLKWKFVENSNSTLGVKLFLKWDVLVYMESSLAPDFRKLKYLWRGWVESFIIFPHFLVTATLYSLSKGVTSLIKRLHHGQVSLPLCHFVELWTTCSLWTFWSVHFPFTPVMAYSCLTLCGLSLCTSSTRPYVSMLFTTIFFASFFTACR